jgi:hypothetical protein
VGAFWNERRRNIQRIVVMDDGTSTTLADCGFGGIPKSVFR